jgi:hypothetical protein
MFILFQNGQFLDFTPSNVICLQGTKFEHLYPNQYS